MIKIPERIDILNDTEEEVTRKWEAIKQWHKENPNMLLPWESFEWETKHLCTPILFSNRAINSSLSEGLEEYKPGEASTRNGGCVSPQ